MTYPDEHPEHPEDEHLDGDGEHRWILLLALLLTAAAVYYLAGLAATYL